MLRVGIIGTGLVAREHAQAISVIAGTATLLAASDFVATQLQEFSASFQVPRRYREATDLIADPDIDLVTITTPPCAHETLVLTALDAGKWVYCEKPLAHTLESATRIIQAESRHPGRLTVGHQFRYDASFRRAAWVCKNGWLGEIESALIERHSYIPHSDFGKNGWWGTWNVAGGGVLITQLIHELDFLFLVMGPPLSVKADMDTRYTDIQSEDYVELIFRFARGREARCVASVNSGRLGGGIEVIGSSGSLSLPWQLLTKDPRHTAQVLAEVERALPDTSTRRVKGRGLFGGIYRRNGTAPPSAHALLYDDIARTIAKGNPLPVSPPEAFVALEACFAAYESALTGTEISLPLTRSSAVYSGISTEAYQARLCRRLAPDVAAVQIPSSSTATSNESRPSRSMRSLVRAVARHALAVAKIDPAFVRAAIRNPPCVHGGPRARRWPWPRRRHFGRRERQAAMRVIDREIRNGGAIIYGGIEERAYCERFAQYLGGGYAKAVNSGTTALYVALRALDLKPGSEVIVPPITDPGGVMPVSLVGCVPIPADAQCGSLNTSVEEIRRVLTDRTSAILVAHIAGLPVEMDPILELAAKRGIPVIEDCAQAHGATYHQHLVGSLGKVSAFSTMYGKHHATGAQGGVVFTKDPLLFERIKQFADRGKPNGARGTTGNVVASLNFNQDEISMAIGRVQLEKLSATIKARRAFVSAVERGLRELDGVSLLREPSDSLGSYLFLTIRFDNEKIGCDSRAFAKALTDEGIDGVSPGYLFPTDQPWYRDAFEFGSSLQLDQSRYSRRGHFDLPNAHQLHKQIVRLDMHEFLGVREAQDLVTALKKIASFYQVYYTAPRRRSVPASA